MKNWNSILKIYMENNLSFFQKVRLKLLYTFARVIPDRKFLEWVFPIFTGYKLNLDNPQTYNEKLQWLKLYDRNPEYTKMVDKYEAKKYVASVIGEEYITPTLAVYDRVEDIDFDALPHQFVLKCTHDSGSVVICKDKSHFDKVAALNKLRKGLKQNYYWKTREWPYKYVKPRIIAEKYITDGHDRLTDYKFFCFNGNAKAMFVSKGRSYNYYDMEFHKLPFEWGGPNFTDTIEKPEGWLEMISLAEKLSKPAPQLRVDFYYVEGRVLFGELTFFTASGFDIFYPSEWDSVMGDWIEISV